MEDRERVLPLLLSQSARIPGSQALRRDACSCGRGSSLDLPGGEYRAVLRLGLQPLGSGLARQQPCQHEKSRQAAERGIGVSQLGGLTMRGAIARAGLERQLGLCATPWEARAGLVTRRAE